MANLNELSNKEIAKIIFNDFDIMQSTTVTGFNRMPTGRLERRGDAIIRILEDMDRLNNFVMASSGRLRRKRRKPLDTVGGYVAHKMWKFKHEIIDSEPRTTIWRIQ